MASTKVLIRIKLLLIIIVASSSAVDQDEYYLATALFFTDVRGKVLFVSGHVPTEVSKAIQGDLKARLQPLAHVRVRVVPSFDNISDITQHKNVLSTLKHRHPDFLTVNLTPAQSTRILEDLSQSNFITETDRRFNDVSKAYINKYTTTTTGTLQTFKTAKTKRPSKAQSLPDHYVPNDIYYGIEKKCANWADGCNANTGAVVNLPVRYFKVPPIEYRPLHGVQWALRAINTT